MPDASSRGRRVSRREVLKISAAGIGALALAPNAAFGVAERESERPTNVLFINTDQQRFDALSCAGSRFADTPNLDRLASEGVRFSHAYTPQPECVPARSCFHTGWTVLSSGCTINHCLESNPEDLKFGEGSFDQLLSKRGYVTEYQGRWHAPLQLADCYQNEVDLRFVKPYREYLQQVRGDAPAPGPGQETSILSGWPYTPDLTHEQLRDSAHEKYNIQYGICTIPSAHTYTGFVGTQSVDALKRLAGQPFSMTCAFLAPHHPWYVPRPFASSVDPNEVDLPSTMNHTRENTPFERHHWQLDEIEQEHMRLFRARYYELVREVDYHVGRILDTLDQLGLAENTLVIFAADHGEMLGEHALTQKFVPYRASVRVPLIMRLPGRIPAGRTINQPVNTIDIPATIFDYLGQPCPKQQGRSLKPLIEGRRTYRSEYTFSEVGWDRGRGWTLFVSHDWKYVWTHSPDVVDMLFDLQHDPNELKNLLGANPDRLRHVGKAREIRARMLEWMENIGHPLRDTLADSEIG